MAMDAKDLRIDSAITATISDGNANYDQNNATLQSNKNKLYQDIGSNSLGKVEAQGARPCAIIGPDRVLPPPTPTPSDAYLKKASVDPWPGTGNVYTPQSDFPQKLPDYQSVRNISPRQTFQENMQRIMVPPYHTTKNVEDNPKSSKVDMPLEVKYCDVPYSINPTVNNQKSIRTSDVQITGVIPLARGVQPHVWGSGVSARPQRPYAPEYYQFPEFANYSGPRAIQRFHRPTHDDPAQVQHDRLYHEANVRFKPYPNVKERYPQHRYDYMNNYSNTYHPQAPFPPQKYDIGKNIPSHPYPIYPQIPMRRMPEPIIDPYQRSNQPNFNPYQNQYIPSYGPVAGNCIPNKMYSYPPEMSAKTLTASKLPYDISNKFYVDYENVRNKMCHSVDNVTYYNDRQGSSKGDIALSMHPGINVHHIPQHHMYRKENMQMKTFETLHYRGLDPSLYVNNTLPRHHLQFSSVIAKSPVDSNASNEAIQSIGILQEDCGYVSQSSTASGRSIDSGNYRTQNEMYRKYNTSSNVYGSSGKNMPKHFSRSHSENGAEKKGLDVRQFLQMWNEGEDEVSESNNTSTNSNIFSTHSETISNPEQLVVLGLVNIPNEELSKYEHIQKISKLPENIKGYNSIELLDQYEQLVETPALRHHKKIIQHEYQFSPKSVAKQTSQLPRPISPLDVEAKISQSVIHKEVGCNFEIKPCSPKMLNIEVATPVQNIMDERTIEKVLNRGITNSLLLSSRSENVSFNSPSISCKMNSPYISNNDLMTRSNYTIKDLESNSGVCLASLPRLDSDIELNFPEINQQFIDANRYNTNPCHENSDMITVNSYKHEHEFNKDLSDLNKTPESNTSIETAKLSKYRKIKSSDSLPDSNLNHTANSRTDSVIIKNPENIRKKDEIIAGITTIENTYILHDNVQEKDFSNTEKMSIDTDNLEDFNSSAIDFSLNKMTQNISNTDTENLILNPNVEENDYKVKDCIPHDDIQLDALSLVTKKVEMELKEFERIENHSESNQTINDSEASLCLNYEDIDTLTDSDRKNDKSCFGSLQTDTEFQSMNITNQDKYSSDVGNSNESNTFLNIIDDIGPYNSKRTLQEEKHIKSNSLQKVDEMLNDEIVIESLQSTNIKQTIIKNVSDDILQGENGISRLSYQNNFDINEKFCKNIEQSVEVSNNGQWTQKYNENNILDLESSMSVLNQNKVKECEQSSQVLCCVNNHERVEDPIEDITVLNINDEHIQHCKNKPTQLITKDIRNEVIAKNETGNIDLKNNNYVCIAFENGENNYIGIREENVDKCPIEEKPVEDELIVEPTTVNLEQGSDRECKIDVSEDGDKTLSMHEEIKIVECEDIVMECENITSVLEAKSILQNEDKNSQLKIPQNVDAISCEINKNPSEEIITKEDHAEIEIPFSILQKPESVMSVDQSFSEVSFGVCTHTTTECTIIDNSNKVNIKVDPKQITRQQNLRENKYSCVESVPKELLEKNSTYIKIEIENTPEVSSDNSAIILNQNIDDQEDINLNCGIVHSKNLTDMQVYCEDNVNNNCTVHLNNKFEPAHHQTKNAESALADSFNNFTDKKDENTEDFDPVYKGRSEVKHYLKKELFSPWMQKLLMFREGSCQAEKYLINIKFNISQMQEKIETKKNTNENYLTTINSDTESVLKKCSKISEMLIEEGIHNDSCKNNDNEGARKGVYVTNIAELKEKLETKKEANESVPEYFKTINNDSNDILDKCSNSRQTLIDDDINIITDSFKKEDDTGTGEDVYVTNILDIIEKSETKKDANENLQDSFTIFKSDSQPVVEKCSASRQTIIKGGINVRTDLCLKDDSEGTRGVNISKSVGEENNMNLTIIMNNETLDNTNNDCLFNQRVNLKRSLSDSALGLYSDSFIGRGSCNKRRKFITEDLLGCDVNEANVCEHIQNNRRKSVSAICNNENVLILIDDNAYVIAEEDYSSHLCDTSELLNPPNNMLADSVSHEPEESLFVDSALSNVDYEQSVEDKTVQEAWVDGVDGMDNIFNDDVAVDITISAPLSPENASLSSSDNYNDDSIYSDNESEHIVRIKEIYGDNMCINGVQIVETLYKMPQMDVNKTLIDIEPHNLQDNQDEVKASSKSCKKQESPNRFDSLEKPQPLCCNNELKILSDKENQDAPLHFNTFNVSNDIQISAEDTTFLNNQNSKDNHTNSFELRDNCKSIVSSNCRYAMSSSPEVSSTTPEEKSSGISPVTSRNSSSRSEINNISRNMEEMRYKCNENNYYTTNYRPLITKAAQKYIPPLIESKDLKVKLPLPQQSLNKLKELKLAKKEFLSDKSNIKSPPHKQGVTKLKPKLKPKFEDVLKSIDEIQFKKHREKSKKTKHSIPKVVIKKNENGAHYASTPMKKSSYNPDLTGRKWQPWVFIERNELVDRMAQRNKHRAIYCHRKKTFVLEEKFKKYKSICTAKFVISQPISDNASSGNLKYTIRLKQNY